MKAKFVIAFAVVFCLSPAITRADTETEPQYPYATGAGLALVAGLTSGVGIGYRQHFENHFGVQVVGGGLYTGDWAGADVGVNGFYTLARGSLARVYLLLGGSAYYNGNHDYGVAMPDGSLADRKWRNDFYFNAGIGVGLEFHFSENIGWAIDVPLSATTKYSVDGWSFISVLPVPSTSLAYYF